MESHRTRKLASQTTTLCHTGYIQHDILGNAFATTATLKAVADTFLAHYPIYTATMLASITPLTTKIDFAAPTLYRGEHSAYLLRDTQPRITYSTASIPAHDTGQPFKRGDIVVVNDAYGRYKGEFQIVYTHFSEHGQRLLIGTVAAQHADLLTLIKPWSTFSLQKRTR